MSVFFSILAHGWFFVLWHTFVLILFARSLWRSKINYILSTWFGWSHGEKTRSKHFWFSLQGGCEGSKIILFFSLAWVDHMGKTLEINFFKSLVSKEVLFFSFFLFPWVHHIYRKLKIFFWLSKFINVFHEFIGFPFMWIFFFVLLLFLLLYATERNACLVQIELVFCMEMY